MKGDFVKTSLISHEIQSNSASPSGFWRAALPGAILALGSFLILAAALLAPQPNERVVVFFAPWSDRLAAFSTIIAAGGLVVEERWGGLAFEVAPERADFAATVLAAGAWAAASPAVLGGCVGGDARRSGGDQQ